MNRLLPYLLALATLALAVAAPVATAEVAPGGASVSALAPAPSGVSVSAAQLDAYLASKGSPMTGQGPAFIASGGRWQVDPRLLVAIAGAESSFGQITCAPFNAWGWGCPNGPYRFDSWADGIDTVMQGLRTNYLADGRTTVALIHQKYAPVGAANDPTGLNNNWTINVSRFIVELGGDPNDLDMDGVAGSLPLGPLGGGPAIEQFGFTETSTDAGGPDGAGTGTGTGTGAGGEAIEARTLEVAAGAPRPLVVSVRNTGSVAWRTSDVRLRRVDLEPRVAGAPFGALANAASVEPGATAKFVVQLAASGGSDGTATTAWRLEGPSGPFGEEILRDVRFAVPAFVAGDPRVVVTSANGGVAGTVSTWNVVVHVRNDGSRPWLREGVDAVLLGIAGAEGAYTGDGWVNERAAARMLERTAAPGEDASFAFRVRGESAALAARPFRASGWAAGSIAIVRLGAVDEKLVTQLRDRMTAR